MAAMTKRVNINAPIAIRNITPPIYGTCNNIVMSTGDILKCLCKRAKVEEILPDGSTVVLTMKNYYTDNGAGLDAEKVKPVAAKKEKAKGNSKKVTTPIVQKVINAVPETIDVADIVPESTTADIADIIPESTTDDVPVIAESVENMVEEVSNSVDNATTEVIEEIDATKDEVSEVAEPVDTEEPVVENIEEAADSETEVKTTAKKNSSKKKSSTNK